MAWVHLGAGSVSALENHALYQHIIKGYEADVKKLFDKIDVSRDGVLEVDEIEEIITGAGSDVFRRNAING